MSGTGFRFDDLLSRSKGGREQSSLMNVKVPVRLLDRIRHVADQLRATKTEVVIALLNDGLAVAEKDLKKWTPPPKPVIPKARRCTVAGCDRERVAKGLCATHYQAYRRAQEKKRN